MLKATITNALTNKIEKKIDFELSIDIVHRNNIYTLSKVNSEGFCRDYYEMKGYDILRITPNIRKKEKGIKRDLEEINKILNKFNTELKYNPLFETGQPDYLMYNDNEFFFVEVKLNLDFLKPDQIKWIEHHNLPTKIFHIKTDVPAI